MSNFPAIYTVHTVSGPVHCCEKHCQKLIGLMQFIGCHVGTEAAPQGLECSNCVNEARATSNGSGSRDG